MKRNVRSLGGVVSVVAVEGTSGPAVAEGTGSAGLEDAEGVLALSGMLPVWGAAGEEGEPAGAVMPSAEAGAPATAVDAGVAAGPDDVAPGAFCPVTADASFPSAGLVLSAVEPGGDEAVGEETEPAEGGPAGFIVPAAGAVERPLLARWPSKPRTNNPSMTNTTTRNTVRRRSRVASAGKGVPAPGRMLPGASPASPDFSISASALRPRNRYGGIRS